MPGKMHIGRSIDQPDVIKNLGSLKIVPAPLGRYPSAKRDFLRSIPQAADLEALNAIGG
jgi:hypothetical protein